MKLMKWKKKSTGFYITFIGYYFLLFIIFIIYFNALGNVTENVLTVRAVRAYRDIILIFYVPQFIFLIISIVRAINVNIPTLNDDDFNFMFTYLVFIISKKLFC